MEILAWFKAEKMQIHWWICIFGILRIAGRAQARAVKAHAHAFRSEPKAKQGQTGSGQ